MSSTRNTPCWRAYPRAAVLAARTVAGAYSRYWEPYLTISLMYWVLTLGLAYVVKELEARYGRGDTR